MKKYILGIDTSAYTTSCALTDYNGNIIYDLRKLLEVQEGQKGLRQETAVFMHLNNLPEIINRIDIDFSEIGIVSVSAFPRNAKDSYMPVFIVGKNYGLVLAKSIGAKYIEYSHQENHLSAAIMNSYKNYDYVNKEFLAIHISGGTTEFMLSKKSNRGFDSKIVGKTLDITFGQLIDRIGVYLGFKFPSGREIETFLNSKKDELIGQKMVQPRISGNECINLSGVENFYKKIIDQKSCTPEVVLLSLLNYISKCIVHIIDIIKAKNDFERVIISGGVSANTYIRKFLLDYYKNKLDIVFPDSILSSDNSLGNAMLPIIDRWYDEIKTN